MNRSRTSKPAGRDEVPNIVLLTCHDLGRHLGAYGVPSVHTPNIDRLAANGVLFERAFSTSSGCSPSRASIATGRYPHNNGVLGLTHSPFNWSLNPDERHIAALLGGAGFETALLGFQHVSTDESCLGFDHCFTEGSALSQKVCPAVDSCLRDRRTDRPLYMEINLEEPHRPYDQGGAKPDERRGVFIPRYLPQTEQARAELASMQGAIRGADSAIGRIVMSLDRAGLLESSLLILLADHGLAMPRAKCTLYDAGLEVACIFHWPAARFMAGSRISRMVSHVDIAPTILEAMGIDIPSRVQGQSFLPVLHGSAQAARTEIFAEKTYHSYYDPMRAIRTDRYKLIVNFESAFAVEVPGDVEAGAIFRADPLRYHGAQHPPVELYDLCDDPPEEENLAGLAGLSDVEADLSNRLGGWMRETNDPLLSGPIASPVHEETLRRINHL